METVKEKLITLLKAADKYAFVKCAEHGSCDECDKLNKGCVNEEKAHYLIQNGVTIRECGMDCKNCWKTKLVNPVQEWVSVDEPPKEDGKYLVLLEQGGMIDAKYEKRRGGFGDYHEDWTEDGLVHTWVPFKIVTHWMPLPAPPKGVQ